MTTLLQNIAGDPDSTYFLPAQGDSAIADTLLTITDRICDCGNGIPAGGESCDDGDDDNYDACRNDCLPNVCGDGYLHIGTEQCDDGCNLGTPGVCENPTDNGDGCSYNCLVESNQCGNGIVQGSELCDDGNGADNDACGNDCVPNIVPFCYTNSEPCLVDDDCEEPDSANCAVCTNGQCGPVAQCSDTLDNDSDTLADTLDPGCHTDGNAGNPNSYDPLDTDETDLPSCGFTLTPTCGDPFVNDNTRGYYNNSLGSFIGDGVNWPSGTPAGTTGPQPEPTFPPSVVASLGTWLTDPASTIANRATNNWSDDAICIPKNWTVTEEVAILYPFTLAAPTHLFGNFGVDNGIYVWVDGVYKFGDEEFGGASAYEYYDVDLGTFPAGTHYLQVLLSDEGVVRDYYISVTSCYACRNGTVENANPAVGCDTLFGPPGVEYCYPETMCTGRDLTETAPYCCRRFCTNNCWDPMTGAPGSCGGGQVCLPYPAENTTNMYDLPCYRCQ
jgi:cysteine-rich repeat protein